MSDRRGWQPAIRRIVGCYNQRLDTVIDPDVPAGTTIWMFDQSDMREVEKKRFSGWACFGGNVPNSMLKAGTPADIKTCVKRLIDFGKEYGVYR